MKPVAFLALAFVALPLALYAAPSGKKTKVLRSGSYRFEIVTDYRVGEWFGWWGAPDTGRGDVVTSVRAFRGKRSLPLPASAFAGLADPHNYDLHQTRRGIELTVVGGDAGGSWRGTFLFNAPGILERTIRSGEFPDLNYERTTYRYIKDGEVN